MGRISMVVCMLLACAIPVLCQGFVPAPAAVCPPQTGVVTLVEADGQFYINLGDSDQIYRGAQLAIFRCGQQIGTAVLIKVNRLDAIAQLPRSCCALCLHPCDQVVVTCNPIPPCRRHKLPAVEPDANWGAYSTTYSLALLAAIVVAICN